MWLRALTILFELRARVSQNLKTTIDINHHLYDNKLAAGLADTLSSAGLSLDYSAQASYQQRGMDHAVWKLRHVLTRNSNASDNLCHMDLFDSTIADESSHLICE